MIENAWNCDLGMIELVDLDEFSENFQRGEGEGGVVKSSILVWQLGMGLWDQTFIEGIGCGLCPVLGVCPDNGRPVQWYGSDPAIILSWSSQAVTSSPPTLSGNETDFTKNRNLILWQEMNWMDWDNGASLNSLTFRVPGQLLSPSLPQVLMVLN